MLTKTHPELAEKLMAEAQQDVESKVRAYELMASQNPDGKE